MSSPAAGGFGAVAPARVLDTRSGVGAPAVPVPAGGVVAVKVTGSNGIPASGVSAVAVNLITLSATRPGYLTAYANGTTRPHANVLNFLAGQTIDNEVIVPVGADGSIALYNGSAGTVHLVADLAGYYTDGAPAAGGFGAVAPARVLDTRSGVGAPAVPVPAGGVVAVKVTGGHSIPASGVSAVAVNLIALSATRPGYLTAYANGAPRPRANVINFVAGQTIDNEVVVPVGADGRIALYNGSSGTVHLLADLAGYYTGGAPAAGGFGAVAPARVLDTRSGLGATAGPVAAGGLITVKVTGGHGIPASGVSAVAVNLIALSATTPGFLTAYASGVRRPRANAINFSSGQTIDNEVIVPVGADGRIALYNGSSGTVHLLADLAGYYTVGSGPDLTPPGPVSGVVARPTPSSVSLRWTNPADSDFAGVVIRRATGSTAPASPAAGTAVASIGPDGNGYLDTGLSAGTTYSYALFAHDPAPNYATAATRTITTPVGPGCALYTVSGFSNYYCRAGAQQFVTADGAYMSTAVQSPAVDSTTGHSLAELAVESADGQQAIQIGWRVLPQQDQTPRLFVFHWVDGHASCYDGCGFVQSGSTTIKPGMALTPSSTPVQFAIKYTQGNWWYGYNGTWFGYLPGSLWNGTFTATGLVKIMGESASGTAWPCTDMGNGTLGTDASATAVTDVGYYNTATAVSLVRGTVEDPTLYDSEITSPNSFRYGGPGAC